MDHYQHLIIEKKTIEREIRILQRRREDILQEILEIEEPGVAGGLTEEMILNL